MLFPITNLAFGWNYIVNNNYITYWPSEGTTMSVSTVSFPSGTANHAALDRAVDSWDDSRIPGSNYQTTRNNSGTTSSSNNDGVNLIFAADIVSFCSFSVLGEDSAFIAATEIRHGNWSNRGEIRETDVMFNGRCDFDNGAYYDIFDPPDQRRSVQHRTDHASRDGSRGGVGS